MFMDENKIKMSFLCIVMLRDLLGEFHNIFPNIFMDYINKIKQISVVRIVKLMEWVLYDSMMAYGFSFSKTFFNLRNKKEKKKLFYLKKKTLNTKMKRGNKVSHQLKTLSGLFTWSWLTHEFPFEPFCTLYTKQFSLHCLPKRQFNLSSISVACTIARVEECHHVRLVD